MFKRRAKSLFSWIGGKVISNLTKLAFWTSISFFGPGAVVSAIGIEGILAAAVLSHSGLVEYTGKKLISRTIII